MKFYCDSSRHMVCVPYSVESLHKMAEALGVKRCWFHPGRFQHYDMPKTRIAELTAKCELVDSKTILLIVKGLVPLTQELFDRIKELTKGVEADLDQPIEGDVNL